MHISRCRGDPRYLSAVHKVIFTAAVEAAAMAAFRRVAALAGKLNLCSAARSELVGRQTFTGGRARRCLTFGVCLATGGALALYFYNDMTSRRGWKKMRVHSINRLLPSIPTVEAKEKVSGGSKLFANTEDVTCWQNVIYS